MSEIKTKNSVLEICWLSRPQGKQQFEDSIVVTLGPKSDFSVDFENDLSEPLPIELWGQYDVVFASHVLEHMRRSLLVETIKRMAMALKPGGELWLITHALEIVVAHMTKDEPSPLVLPLLYGADTDDRRDDFHSAFTLRMLRAVLVDGGLILKFAEQRPNELMVGKDKFQSILNVVVGVKEEE